jgi:hypothetical protein
MPHCLWEIGERLRYAWPRATVKQTLCTAASPLKYLAAARYCAAVPAVLRPPILLVLLMLLAVPLAAQEPVEQPGAPADTCPGGRISYVFIDNKSIFDTADPDLDRRFLWAYRTANTLHRRTREWVIRRELLFGPGSCYDQFLLEETERLLRAYDFLARVDIFAVPRPDGTYHVIVSTRDEWSTRVDVRVTSRGGFGLEGIRVTEDNLLGTGQSIGVFYFEREVTRDYGISYFTPQFVGTRWDLTAALARTRAGTAVQEEIAYPFIGEVSRWAGRQNFRREDQFFNYIIADDPALVAPHALLPLREQAFDVAVVRRIGQRGNSALVGAALSYQQLTYPGSIQLAPDGDFDRRVEAPDSVAAVTLRQRSERHNLRGFALLGHRSVWWIQRRGLDSMRGQEDVRLGAEVLLGLGRSLPSIEVDDDLYGMLLLYAGFQAGDALLIGRGRADARRDLAAPAGSPEWDDVYFDGELLGYLQPAAMPRHTLFMRAAATAGWHTRTPFQLTLGGEYGLRGYDEERMPGGRRVMLTLEDRFYLGWPLRSVLDVGGTAFLDVGRVWAGDAPFGIDTGWRGSVGLGLRSSFPAGSRSTYRVDFAWPLEAGAGLGDFRVSLSVGELRGMYPRYGDFQLLRSRTMGVAGDLFTFRH